MALKLRSLRRKEVTVPLNPETFLKSTHPTADGLENDLPEKMKFSQWKRVEVEEKGRKKQVMRIVETEVERATFIASFENQKNDFSNHVWRVRKQYEEIKKLKENLSKNHYILQMDFAENYACKSSEEIQSAYWNMTGVTLHPVVVYYASEKDH